MKRAGFTMIELIFVIVILGILAAVAVPKLSATRNDAKVAKMATNVSTLVSDIGAHYTSQGTMGNTFADMTNVLLSTGGDSTSGTLTNGLVNAECLTFEYTDTNGAVTTVPADAQGVEVGLGANAVLIAAIVGVAGIPANDGPDGFPGTADDVAAIPAVVAADAVGADPVCSSVASKVASMLKNHKFGGTGIVE